ncbi:MAG: magnesium transporter CorA family protein [Gemmatimonadaceae bacterium]|nr:magnesium transporter CorA family protein [Gemmatimonadaceae bacterium]
MQGIIAEHRGQLWVDVDATSRGQVSQLERLTTLHPLAMEDALNPVSRGKIEEYNGFLFTVIRGVRFHVETEDPYDLETFNIACFLGRNFLVTVHHGKSEAVAGAVDRLVRNPDLLGRGADRMMHLIMDAAVDAYFPLLDQIDDFVDGLEERVFEQFDEVVLRDIFAVKRLVLSLRRHLGPQREVFNVLTNRPSPYLGAEGQLYFRDIHDHVLRITESLETYRDLLGSTMDSYLTQVSNRLGMATKGLSAVATVSIPFVIVSGMWGMNFAHIPFSDAPQAFWWMLVMQLVTGLLLYMLLRWRRLL